MPDRSMNILEKRDLIVSLNTKGLIDSIYEAETTLEKALREELDFRSKTGDFLPGRHDRLHRADS